MQCGCGNWGCLVALAGGKAVLGQATAYAMENPDSELGKTVAAGEKLGFHDLARALAKGDLEVNKLVAQSARRIGQLLATLANFHNPSNIVIGGQMSSLNSSYLAIVRETVFRRALPLATRNLWISTSALGEDAGLIGAAQMTLDEIFEPKFLALWLNRKTPRSLAATGARGVLSMN